MRFDESRDEARHRRGEIAAPMHQMNACEFWLLLPGEIALDPRTQRLARHLDMQQLDHRDGRTGMDAVPMRFRAVIRRRKAGLLLDLARDAALDIEHLAPDVVEIGRAGRKIDAPGVG